MKRDALFVIASSILVLGGAVNVVQADVTSHSWDPSHGGSINEDPSPIPLVGRPTRDRIWVDIDPGDVAAANTNIVYLNNCQPPQDCFVTRSSSANSINNTWPLNVNSGTLSPYKFGDASWNNVVSCLREVFGPFGIDVRTQDPGNVNHFEIMIAGSPGQLGFSNGVGGISPFSCQQFIPNSLVFDFADVWGGDVEETCSTAAQEIAHSFALDHTTVSSDPLTYFAFNGRRHYLDGAEQCGSDCGPMSGLPIGQAPFGQTCTGPNVGNVGPQNHTCTCNNQNTQNSFQTIKALFGTGTPTPPIVTITSPKTGDQVTPGFPVSSQVSDDQGVSKAELYVDGALVQTLTTLPFAFNAPASLPDGTHTAEVRGYDVFGAVGKASVQVIIGKPCTKPGDCPNDTDTCVGGRCVPGPGVQGGLGDTCTSPNDCSSGQCAMSTDGSYCVEQCALNKGQCPSGFGCLDTGAGDGNGVCFPGVDEGGGCLSAGGSAGSIGLGLGFAMLLVFRRRRR